MGGGPGLAQKDFGLGRVELILARDFQGDGAVQLGIAGHPHTAEAANADLIDQLEVADRPGPAAVAMRPGSIGPTMGQ